MKSGNAGPQIRMHLTNSFGRHSCWRLKNHYWRKHERATRLYAKLLFGRSEQEERVAAESRTEVKITRPQLARLLIANKHWAWPSGLLLVVVWCGPRAFCIGPTCCQGRGSLFTLLQYISRFFPPLSCISCSPLSFWKKILFTPLTLDSKTG